MKLDNISSILTTLRWCKVSCVFQKEISGLLMKIALNRGKILRILFEMNENYITKYYSMLSYLKMVMLHFGIAIILFLLKIPLKNT